MYKIFVGDTCIYRDAYTVEETSLSEPKLTLADNSAGQLSFTMAPTNAGFKSIQHLTTRITVYKDNKWLWEGRAISEQEDFWHNRIITCEGALAFLNDTHQPPAEYHNQTPEQFLTSLIRIHNSKVAADKQFTVGKVTVTDPNNSIYRYTNYETTFECLNDKLIKQLGGHFVVRREGSTLYLDYLADYNPVNAQPIEFGNNLLDFTRSYDLTDFCTVVVPKGKQLESSPIEALEAYTTVASVNDGSIYVQNETAVKAYGWIEKVVEWSDVEEPSNLLRKAKEYLADTQFDDMTLELKAVDLHYLNKHITDISLLDQVKVISRIHGLNRTFPVTKLDIPMDNPDQATFSLGDVKKVKEQTYTQSTATAISNVQTQVEENNTSTSVRLEATSDSIEAEVKRAEDAEASLSIRADEIVSSVSDMKTDFQSQINQKPNSITLSVTNGYRSSSIVVSLRDANGNQLDSDSGDIQFTGDVVFASDLTDGTTKISGSNILTGTISAERIDVDNLVVKQLKTGTHYSSSSGEEKYYGVQITKDGAIAAGDGFAISMTDFLWLQDRLQVEGITTTGQGNNFFYGNTYLYEAYHGYSGSTNCYCYSRNSNKVTFEWNGTDLIADIDDGRGRFKIAKQA